MIPRSLAEVHLMDFGTVFSFEVRSGRNKTVDLSEVLVYVLFMRPDGSGFSRVGQLGSVGSLGSLGSLESSSAGGSIPGSDGTFFYVLAEGDIDMEGQWYLQAYLKSLNGAWYSSVVAFVVFPNLVSVGEILTP